MSREDPSIGSEIQQALGKELAHVKVAAEST